MSLESYFSLCARLGLSHDLPYTPKWSAAADFLGLIVEHALTCKPNTIVECGSGMTTVMLARCCAINGAGHIYSLENGAEFAANTREAVMRHGLQAYSTVIHAPLRPHTVNAHSYQWYAIEHLDVSNIDMLVIDGPPGFLQHHSRYPALPLLRSRLAATCTVYLDDAARQDEQEIVRLWLRDRAITQLRYVANERGCSILQFNPHGT